MPPPSAPPSPPSCTPPAPPPLHLAMVPYPLQGHINPMVQLAKLLIAHHNVVVSFINIKQHHDSIQKTRGQDTLAGKLRFVYVQLDGLPPDHFDFTDLMPKSRDFNAALSSGMQEPLKHLLQSLTRQSPPVSCVCFGSFCPWVHTVSAELGLPSVCLWTQSASVFSMYYHVPLLQTNGFFPFTAHERALRGKGIVDDEVSHEPIGEKLISYVPGLPPLRPSIFPTQLQVDNLSDPKFNRIKDQFSIIPRCQGLIVNSFEDLEKDCYRALQEILPCPVSFVGPLIPSAYLKEGDGASDTSVGASLLEENMECIKWLDCQRKHSVLYVSFGSVFQLSREDLGSVANGIRASRQPFLWVIRSTSSVLHAADILPEGFMEDTKGQGMIVPWAPQLQVLSHPSVGAFLTHCGWNSTLESISMGVPMIPCPFQSDQPANATYVCDIWKVGKALVRHEDGVLRSPDIERVVRTVLLEGEGAELRKNAMKLREAARLAGGAGGYSTLCTASFTQFVK